MKTRKVLLLLGLCLGLALTGIASAEETAQDTPQDNLGAAKLRYEQKGAVPHEGFYLMPGVDIAGKGFTEVEAFLKALIAHDYSKAEGLYKMNRGLGYSDYPWGDNPLLDYSALDARIDATVFMVSAQPVGFDKELYYTINYTHVGPKGEFYSASETLRVAEGLVSFYDYDGLYTLLDLPENVRYGSFLVNPMDYPWIVGDEQKTELFRTIEAFVTAIKAHDWARANAYLETPYPFENREGYPLKQVMAFVDRAQSFGVGSFSSLPLECSLQITVDDRFEGGKVGLSAGKLTIDHDTLDKLVGFHAANQHREQTVQMLPLYIGYTLLAAATLLHMVNAFLFFRQREKAPISLAMLFSIAVAIVFRILAAPFLGDIDSGNGLVVYYVNGVAQHGMPLFSRLGAELLFVVGVHLAMLAVGGGVGWLMYKVFAGRK